MQSLSTLKTGDCCCILHIDVAQRLHNSLLALYIEKGCRLHVISSGGTLVVRSGVKLFVIDRGLADGIHVVKIPMIKK